MNMQLTDLADRPRLFRFYPRVCRVGFLEEVVFLRERLLEDYQFCFQLQGSPGATTVNIDGRDYRADFPRVLIKRKGEVHRIDVPGRVSSVYFVYPPEAPFDDWIPRDLVLFSLEFTPALQALSRRIIDFASAPVVSGCYDHLDRYCWDFMHEALLTHFSGGSRRDSPEDRVDEIILYLQMHFTEQIDYRTVAGKFGYSLRTLNRHWSKKRTDSPAGYVNYLRMTEAQRLLKETPYSVERIAAKLNFHQCAYFIRRFKAFSGMTPRQYRFSPPGGPPRKDG